MKHIPTRLEGPLLLRPRSFPDDRGFFVETFRESSLQELGVSDRFVQDNHSRSSYGVIRGMHFQLDPPASKLVRCVRGAIMDVLVDLRSDSPNFGEWESYRLDDETLDVLYVPVGFAHGFCVTTEVADVVYKQSGYWSPGADRGISVADPDIGIEWPVTASKQRISPRDMAAPLLRDVAPESLVATFSR